MSSQADEFCENVTQYIVENHWQHCNNNNAAACEGAVAVAFSELCFSHQLAQHLERVHCEAQPAYRRRQVWGMIRLLTSLSYLVFFGPNKLDEKKLTEFWVEL